MRYIKRLTMGARRLGTKFRFFGGKKTMSKVEEILSLKGISYQVLSHSKPVYTCEEAARERNVPLHEMVKTILLVDKSGQYCIPGNRQLNLQKVREALKLRRLSFASREEVKQVTGYEVGSVPPVGLAKEIPIIFDSCIAREETINISAGMPTKGLQMAAKQLINLVSPLLSDISVE